MSEVQLLHAKKMQAAAKHLAAHDPVLAPIIAQHGLCTIQPHSNYYQELVESIIGQQLSVKAAATITKRFVELFSGNFPTPQQIIEADADRLRSVGLSRAKANYVQDLALHVLDGRLEINRLLDLSNEQIVAKLTSMKGIGEWTAHMFLMFSLGRLEVLAIGDLGIKNGIQKLYKLASLPDAAKIRQISQQNNWQPFETVACWYVWQSLNNESLKQK